MGADFAYINGPKDGSGKPAFTLKTSLPAHIIPGPKSNIRAGEAEFVMVRNIHEELHKSSSYGQILRNLSKIPQKLNSQFRGQNLPECKIHYASDPEQFLDYQGPICVLIPEKHCYERNKDLVMEGDSYTLGQMLKTNQAILKKALEHKDGFKCLGLLEGYIDPSQLKSLTNNHFTPIYADHNIQYLVSESRYEYIVSGLLIALTTFSDEVGKNHTISGMLSPYFKSNGDFDKEAFASDIQTGIKELGLADFVTYEKIHSSLYNISVDMPRLHLKSENTRKDTDSVINFITGSFEVLENRRDQHIVDSIERSNADLTTMVVGCGHVKNLQAELVKRKIPVIVIGSNEIFSNMFEEESPKRLANESDAEYYQRQLVNPPFLQTT
ncbi:MAG: hypothetical protein LW817_02915 [Candidatus Caenarcaniphilales bacterium]|jgi:hypothetical protein|nr:hypothetical protein [Candidatus Caenarcaniphilales bacterium]